MQQHLEPCRFRRSAVLLAAIGLALGIALAAARPAVAAIATQYQIETDLTCQCGCGLTVHSCNHLNCGSGIPLKKEIAEQIAAGRSREDILDRFEAKYGEKILSSPTARGFNIAAWTVPFVAIALGGVLISVVLVRWRRSSGGPPDAGSTPPRGPLASDPQLRARLDRELADLERRS